MTVTSIGDFAFGSMVLYSLYIPESVTTIGRRGFSCNYELLEENIIFENPDNLPLMGEDVFSNSDSTCGV